MTYNIYVCIYSVYNVDYRGAAAPKKNNEKRTRNRAQASR